MITNNLSINRRFAAASLGLLTLALTLTHARGANSYCSRADCMVLHLRNQTAQPVTFTIETGPCYQGTGCGGACANPNLKVLGPVPPGGTFDMELARVQTSDCDGENGYFSLIPSNRGGEKQSFGFAHTGTLWISNIPNRFDGVLSAKSPADGSYTWIFQEVEARLSGPLDERLTMPRNRIARNFGTWDGGIDDRTNDEPQPGNIVADHLEFRRNGFNGMTYTECAGQPMFHAQHIVRLPNKNGRAYFMVSDSGAYIPDEPGVPGTPRGVISVYQSDSLDPVTDLVPNNPGTDGEIVWEHSFELPYSLIGGWNHPCKMDVIGGVLVISMLDWDAPDVCRDGYDRGSEQAIVFYDVRDPANPKYWGKMTQSQLGIGNIEDVSLGSIGDEWILYANDKWWRTTNVSPNIESWTFGGTGNPEANLQGQYFNSYELYDGQGQSAPAGTTFPGVEQVMWGNGDGDDDEANRVSGDEFLKFSHLRFFDATLNRSIFPAATFDSFGHDVDLFRPAPNIFGGVKDYDACGVSVRGAMPVFYSPLIDYRDEVGGDTSADHIWQIWHPANVALAPYHPDQLVTNVNDSGPGSLRRAMAYGGNITFAQNLNGGTINLTSGPLVVHLYDVNIDASALSNGITIQGKNSEPVFMVAPGNTLTRQGLNGLTFVTSASSGWFGQTAISLDGIDALRSGAIGNSQSSYMETIVQGPGTLTFWWRVSSERNPITGSVYDYLRFTMDGAEQAEVPGIAGVVGWQQHTLTVPAGTHTLRWIYIKNGSDIWPLGQDAGWVDQVVFTPAADIARGIQAYWTFDEILLDSVSAFHGTENGARPVAFAYGKAGFGKALQLDGTDQFVEITGGQPDDLAFAGGSVSIAGWFKVGSFDTQWQALVAKGEGSNWRVARRADEAGIAYAGGLTDTPTGKGVNDGAWHHFVAISDAAGTAFGTAIYIDGARDTIVAGAPVLAANGRRVMIGENPDFRGREWNGQIDDLAVWNRVLAPEEISSLYAGGTGKSVRSFLDLPQLSNNADLAGLVPSVGTLSPAFSSGTTAYTVIVPNATGSVTLSPSAAQANAMIDILGVPVASGGSLEFGIGPGSEIDIVVTAQDGTVKTYIVTFIVDPTANVVPVAIAQTLQVELGKPTVVTLAGYDPEGRTLFYTLTTLPTNGDLARYIGEPWLTYTPTTLGTGEDSFTFVVNDGTLYGLNRPDSIPATVTIHITTGLPSPSDVTRPGDLIASLNGAGQSPLTEQVANAIDDSPITKYLNFGEGSAGVSPFRGITGFSVTPGIGASVVSGLGLTSANDSPERDPASYRLEGSNDGTAFILIAEGAVPPFSGRFIRQELSFPNLDSYEVYRLTFPTILNAETANSMQIAEVELLGMIVDDPPLEISINHVNGLITIEYTGTLESANQVTGPYTPVVGALSPFTMTPDGGSKFFIAR